MNRDDSRLMKVQGKFAEDVWFQVGAEPQAGGGADRQPSGHMAPAIVWPDLAPGTRTLPRGYQVAPEYRPTVCEMVMHQDVAIVLRDGVTIYADVFLPTGAGPDNPVPVLLAYTWFGKQRSINTYDLYADRALMRRKYSTGLDVFEGPEPDYWVSNGYAVAHVDARGASHSEGLLWGPSNELADDLYDTVEWLGTQQWSTGRVGMVGNSYLASVQYFAAASQPPHLGAIAPWEALSDPYRDLFARGGMPAGEFMGGIVNTLRYTQGVEHQRRMLEDHPLMDEYWREHMRAPLERIVVPMYITASWTSNLHPYGTLRAWRLASSTQKWLRVHNSQEWPDQQTPENRDDLRRFFDHFLKRQDNGWEATPRVRMALLDSTGHDRVNVPFSDFPVPATQYRRLHLDAAVMKLHSSVPVDAASIAYEVEEYDPKPRDPFSKADWSDQWKPLDHVQFRLKVEEDLVLGGYFRTKLSVSSDGDDMDLFLYVDKEDAIGQTYRPRVLGVEFAGAEGRIRLSHRRVESDQLHDWKHAHTEEELVEPGQVVEVETVLWPLGMVVRAGETIVFTIAGSARQLFEFPVPQSPTRNVGRQVIHTGEGRPAWLELPVIAVGLDAIDGGVR